MAFGNISIDPASFAPQNGQNGLLSGLMLGAQMRAYQEDREQKRIDQEKEQALAGAMQGVDPNDPATFKPLYGINPLLAMKLETEAVERRKALSQEESANQEKLRGAYTDWAKGFSQYWAQLPPNQRNPQTAHTMLGAAVNHYQTMNPALARVLATAPKDNPQWLEHALQNGGFTDPYAQDQREFESYQRKARFDNQMPMNAEQRDASARGWAGVDMQQQGLAQAERNAQADRWQKYWDNVKGEQQFFEGQKPVQMYKVVASEMNSLSNLATQDNKAADLGIIIGAAKIGDPLGSVREGDQVLWSGTGSWFEKLRGYWSTLKEEGRLTPKMRAEIIKEARTKVEALKGGFDTEVKNFSERATKRGFEPGDFKTDAQSIEPSKLEKIWDALNANPNNAAQIKAVAKKHGIPDSLLW